MKERHEEPVTVYNLAVKDWVSYFVEKVRVYVHNGIGYTPDSKTYKEINIHGEIDTEIDEVDLVNQIIYEDKSAGKLYIENADFPQTEQQWALKQIYKKETNRIDAIN